MSSPCEKNANKKLDTFLEGEFDFEKIKQLVSKFVIIHGHNDPLVPRVQAQFLAKVLNGTLILIKNGGHLNGSAGWFMLPECLDVLGEMF